MGRINSQNLVSLADRPVEERREIAAKSLKARRRNAKARKLMSEIYADYINKTIKLGKDGDVKMKPEVFFSQVATKVLARGDAASVAMLKELREATEGSKQTINAEVGGMFRAMDGDERMKEFNRLIAGDGDDPSDGQPAK